MIPGTPVVTAAAGSRPARPPDRQRAAVPALPELAPGHSCAPLPVCEGHHSPRSSELAGFLVKTTFKSSAIWTPRNKAGKTKTVPGDFSTTCRFRASLSPEALSPKQGSVNLTRFLWHERSILQGICPPPSSSSQMTFWLRGHFKLHNSNEEDWPSLQAVILFC